MVKKQFMKSKEEIKKDAERVASAYGYNGESMALDVINVKDAYCNGYINGGKEVATDFAKWITINCSGRPNTLPGNEWYYFAPNMERKRVTTEELFELYLKSTK